MAKYTKYSNGQFIDVYDIDDCIRSIQYRNKDNEDRIKYLEEENKKLKEDHYKDEEIQKMQQKLDRMQKALYRGFPISEDEKNAIEEWKKKHDAKVHGWKTSLMRQKAEGVSGGRYTYVFIPTTLGTSGIIKCHCGAKFEFQEIG